MVPHIILVMDDHDLVLKPMVTWGSRMTYLRSPIYTVYIYMYVRQMPGLCPETQPRQATHHHHHQQTLFEIIQNQDRSLTRMGELNPY